MRYARGRICNGSIGVWCWLGSLNSSKFSFSDHINIVGVMDLMHVLCCELVYFSVGPNGKCIN